MLIYINDELVFDGSWNTSFSNLLNSEETFRGPKIIGQPFKIGNYMSIKPGSELRIVIGETPGGLVGGALFIQEEGKQYREENGHLVLPPFATSPLREEDKERLSNMRIPIEVEDVPLFMAK